MVVIGSEEEGDNVTEEEGNMVLEDVDSSGSFSVGSSASSIAAGVSLPLKVRYDICCIS